MADYGMKPAALNKWRATSAALLVAAQGLRHSMISAHNSLQRGKQLERSAVMHSLVMHMARSIAPAVTRAAWPALGWNDVTGSTVSRFGASKS